MRTQTNNKKPAYVDEVTPEMVRQTVNGRFPNLAAFLERIDEAMYNVLYFVALYGDKWPMHSPKALAMVPTGGYEFDVQNLYAAVYFLTAVCNDAADEARVCDDKRELAAIEAMEYLLP